MYKDPIRL